MAVFFVIVFCLLLVVAIVLLSSHEPKSTSTYQPPDKATSYQKDTFDVYKTYSNDYKTDYSEFENRKIESAYLYPKKDIIRKIRHNPFLRKKVLITGLFDNFYERNDLAKILWEYGADIDTALSERIDIILMGEEPGQNKVEFVNYSMGKPDIRIIKEPELLEIFQNIDNSDVDFDQNSKLKNTNIVVTGDFKNYYGTNFKLLIKDYGANVSSKATTKTDIVIIGENPNQIYLENAIIGNIEGRYQITFMNEDEFINLLQDNYSDEFAEDIPDLRGKKVNICGEAKFIPKTQLKYLLTLIGCNIQQTYNSSTDIVIIGHNPSLKALEFVKQASILNPNFLTIDEKFAFRLFNIKKTTTT